MTSLDGIKIAVLVDDMRVTRWQAAALASLGNIGPLSVYSCTNTYHQKNIRRHAFYYALAFWCVRNPRARPVPIDTLDLGSVVSFAAEVDGVWQSLPADVLEHLQREQPDIVLKFGMGLLRVPPLLAASVLSYHHGDPTAFRGRPAGFYEMASQTPVMGQIVQRLSNKLDAGAVLAFAETKVHPHSYRRTLVEAFQHSPHLLRPAIANALAGKTIDKAPLGRNYRLPSNAQVARLAAGMAVEAVKRWLYGAIVEKRWQVCVAPLDRPADVLRSSMSLPTGKALLLSKRYSFAADPFFWNGEIVAEAMNARTGLGEIVEFDDAGPRRISPSGGHFSYPATVEEDGETFVVPETASWLPPTIYRRTCAGLERLKQLNLGEDLRLLDPTFLRHGGTLYLFANRADVGANTLFLWWSASLLGRFEMHPLNPISITPRGSRMAGNFVQTANELIRFGQDGSAGYGNGVYAFSVDALSRQTFRERPLTRIALEGRRGPHTINFGGGRIVYDFYADSISPFAGVRRLLARLSRKI